MSVVVERLAGSFLVRGAGRSVLVGQPKAPCDWPSRGFDRPAGIDDGAARRFELVGPGPDGPTGPRLRIERPLEAVVDALERRMLVARNGSASERLWTLVLDVDPDDDVDDAHVVDAAWLVDMPERAFAVIRDAVLRCV